MGEAAEDELYRAEVYDGFPPTKRAPHCAYCNAGFDRTAGTGGQKFIHVLTRGAGGQILKWHLCTLP